MAKIADKIREWADKNVRGSNAVTRDADAYNAISAAVQELLAQPWAQMEIPDGPTLAPAEEKSHT